MVFRAPSGPAAREIATRELRSEWSISKPALALRTLRRPPNQWCRVADVWLGASSRSSPWPCRRPPALQPCPLASSGPSGALQTSGAGSLTCGSVRRLGARPGPAAAHRHCSQAHVLKPGQDPSLRINVARNSPSSISNIEFTSLVLQRFETFFKTDRVKLRATFV